MLAKCSRCSIVRNAHRDRKTRKMVCDACKQHERLQNSSRVEPCGRCQKRASVAKRDTSGTPICHTCYRKAHREICSLCHQNKSVETRDTLGQPICQWCYNTARYHNTGLHEVCYGCGKRKHVAKRDRATGYAICSVCRRDNFPEVHNLCWCGRKRPVGKRGSKSCPLGHPEKEPIHLRIVFTA